MEMQQPYYLFKMKEILSLKQKGNPHYSLRAFARDLDMHPSTVSQIIKGKRPLPFKDSANVLRKLELSPQDRTLFLESLMKVKTRLDKIKIEALDQRFMLDEAYYKIIAEWEHYAVLDLFDLEDFEVTHSSVSEKLGITENRSDVVISNLLSCGLLKRSETGVLLKVHADIRTTEDISNKALRESHCETLKMGIIKLEEVEVELRDFSSTTVAIDLEKLPEAKAIIREFRQKMSALLRDGHKTEVYQLGIQFYPLTKMN